MPQTVAQTVPPFRRPPARRARPALRRVATPSCLVVLAVLAACGGGDGPASPPGGGGGGGGGGGARLSASIGGAAYASAPAQVRGAAAAATPGLLTITGNNAAASTPAARALALTLGFIPGPGTYPLGVNPGTTAGGLATVVIGADGYTTPLSGAAGTVTIVTLTASRATGTFSFTAEHQAPGDGRTVSVTGGDFDVPITPAFATVPAARAGSVVRAAIGGAAWNAATIATAGGSGSHAVAANNTTRALSLFVGPVTAPGTFPLSAGVPVARITVREGSAGGPCCWGGTAADVGSIVVTAVSADRIVGTFTGTLAPAPGGSATAPLTVTDGVFELRLGN